MQIIGQVDRLDETFIEGGCMFADRPDIKLRLEVMLRDTVVAKCTADLFRADLKEAGIADGKCAFSLPVPVFVPRSEIGRLRIRLEASIAFLDIPGLGITLHTRAGADWHGHCATSILPDVPIE